MAARDLPHDPVSAALPRLRRTALATCATLALALALGPAPAHGWELSFDGSRFHFDADPGEQNSVNVFFADYDFGAGDEPAIVFDDDYDITDFDTYVENNCPNYFSPGDDTAVVCPRDSESSTVTLADGDDELLEGDGHETVSGGPGADTLLGRFGDDVLDGGEDDDRLEADPLATLESFVTPGADVLSGGPGFDRLGYADTDAGFTLTLDGAANDPGGDNVGGDIELVIGGGGDDRMIGNAAPNQLDGASGDDELHGRGGDDVLDGSSDRDRVYGDEGNDEVRGGPRGDMIDGGPGNDRFIGDPGTCTVFSCPGGDDDLQARDGFADDLACGVGTDRAVVDELDVVATDLLQGCEVVDRPTGQGQGTLTGPGAGGGGPGPPAFSVVARSRVTVRRLLQGWVIVVRCAGPCRVDAGLFVSARDARRHRLPARRIGRGRRSLSAAGDARVRIRLARRARRGVRRVRRLNMRLRVTVTDPSGGTAKQSRRVRVTRGRRSR